MKKSLLGAGLLLLLVAGANLFAQDRAPWAGVAAPTITSVAPDEDDPIQVKVNFNLETPRDGSGADGAQIVVSGPESFKVVVGATRRAAKSGTFVPKKTGTYSIVVYGIREGESEQKASAPATYEFKLPLEKPSIALLNKGKGSVGITWEEVPEADGYVVSYRDEAGKTETLAQTKETSAQIDGLSAGKFYDVTVAAIRGSESSVSDSAHKLVKDEVEREWYFTWFGTSTGAEQNTMSIIDPNNLTVKLNSCTFDPSSQNIIKKGGKFTAFFDGVSFYYTVIDPKTENFDLKVTVTVDYQNPNVDGQEGFAVYALDRIGNNRDVTAFPTNSAGIVSTKYTTHVNGVKKEIKNGVGARFVTGITPAVLDQGDAGIAANAISKGQAYSYDQNSDAVRTGRVYKVQLKKDNTGYHAIMIPEVVNEDTITEYILYDSDNKKLTQLDKEHVYVGFAVARGLNATFSDVSFTVTDPKNDPPPSEEPPDLLPLKAEVDSPTTYHTKKYPFVFAANSDGKLTVTDANDPKKVYISNADIKMNVDFKKTLTFADAINDLQVNFTPKEGFMPMPKTVIAQYNRENGQYEEDYKTVSIVHTVNCRSFAGKQLFVSTEGTVFGDGSRENPLDLATALNHCSPGQEVIMLEGTYYPDRAIIIERGNSGTKSQRKVLRSEDGKRAVLNFKNSTHKVYGLIEWGDYWTFKNFDVTESRDNIKAFQIAGNYNIVEGVDAYNNGDTGIQIAGQAKDTFEKWPSHNLILNCTAYNNCDPAENNADGFAAKLTVGDGNVFRGCVAYNNIDDGWDLFSKIETGPIGAVLVENCVAFRNGFRLDGSGNGDGNGFKMGGEGIDVHHVLRNSLSFENGYNGITSNSNPGLILDRVTSYGNKNYNVTLYGKAKNAPLTCKANGVISFYGGNSDLKELDKFGEIGADKLKELTRDDNYFYYGNKPVNASNEELDDSIFVSVDTGKIASAADNYKIKRKADGSIDLEGLFVLNDKAPAKSGARVEGYSSKASAGGSGSGGNSAVSLTVLVIIVALGGIIILKKDDKKKK